MEFDLNMHTARLLMSEPFFAALSRNITKRANSSIPTAGVRVNEETGQFEMIYNPEFFAKLPDDHVRGVLKHEFYHLIFGHVTGDRFHKATGGKMTKIWNVATDLAINSHLVGELPELACIPGQNQFANFPLGKSAEWYHAELKKEQNKDDSDGEGEEGDPGAAERDGDVLREAEDPYIDEDYQEVHGGGLREGGGVGEPNLRRLGTYVPWFQLVEVSDFLQHPAAPLTPAAPPRVPAENGSESGTRRP